MKLIGKSTIKYTGGYPEEYNKGLYITFSIARVSGAGAAVRLDESKTVSPSEEDACVVESVTPGTLAGKSIFFSAVPKPASDIKIGNSLGLIYNIP